MPGKIERQVQAQLREAARNFSLPQAEAPKLPGAAGEAAQELSNIGGQLAQGGRELGFLPTEESSLLDVLLIAGSAVPVARLPQALGKLAAFFTPVVKTQEAIRTPTLAAREGKVFSKYLEKNLFDTSGVSPITKVIKGEGPKQVLEGVATNKALARAEQEIQSLVAMSVRAGKPISYEQAASILVNRFASKGSNIGQHAKYLLAVGIPLTAVGTTLSFMNSQAVAIQQSTEAGGDTASILSMIIVERYQWDPTYSQEQAMKDLEVIGQFNTEAIERARSMAGDFNPWGKTALVGGEAKAQAGRISIDMRGKQIMGTPKEATPGFMEQEAASGKASSFGEINLKEAARFLNEAYANPQYFTDRGLKTAKKVEKRFSGQREEDVPVVPAGQKPALPDTEIGQATPIPKKQLEEALKMSLTDEAYRNYLKTGRLK